MYLLIMAMVMMVQYLKICWLVNIHEECNDTKLLYIGPPVWKQVLHLTSTYTSSKLCCLLSISRPVKLDRLQVYSKRLICNFFKKGKINPKWFNKDRMCTLPSWRTECTQWLGYSREKKKKKHCRREERKLLELLTFYSDLKGACFEAFIHNTDISPGPIMS